MKIMIDIPEKTFKYYVTLANKGEQIGNLERIILDGTQLKEDQDCISRQAVLDMMNYGILEDNIKTMPSVTPQQSIEDWLSTFNTESATECFTAVQQLKEKIYD